MSLPGDGEDRAAILRRRAAFVATALTGLAPRVAWSQDAASPPPEAPAVPEPASLAPSAECAPAQPADAEVAVARMELLLERGEPEEAAAVGLSHVACGGDLEAVRPLMREIELASGRVVIRLTGGDVANGRLLVDGRPVDGLRSTQGIFVTPGRHAISYVTPAGAVATKSIAVVAGELATLELEAPPDVPPMPCLNYVPPRGTSERVRLEAGVLPPVPMIALGDSPRAVVSVGGRLALQAALPEPLWLEADLFSTFVGDATTRAVQLGGSLELRASLTDQVGFGGGFGAGYLFELSDELERGALRPSFFCGPVLLPVHLRFGDAEVEIRLPLWIARTSVEGVEAFRPALFGPQLAISFAGGVAPRDEYED
ncbi:MAG: hypothetical protein IPG04_29295 [Polyangiaceae bacterium]|nr:hypothetical protein [Polyangiaceae bacterium]